MSGVKFAEAKDAKLAWIDGRVKLRNHDNTGVDNVPVLDVLPQTEVRDITMYMYYFYR